MFQFFQLMSFFILFLTGCFPKKQHIKPSGTQKLTINDFSRLNETSIYDSHEPGSVEELKSLVQDAQRKHIPVAVAGSLHSQGGHAFYHNARIIHLNKLNQILDFDPQRKTITVQTGITWREIQEYLNPRGYAVKIMQVANVFTVGGALSVNANGIDPHCGPLIESVRSLKILLSDGTIVPASRTENSQLFRLAIGGYGLFGIILEATLDVVENDFYKRGSCELTFEQYPQFLKNVASNSTIGFHFGQVNFAHNGNHLFSNITAISYKKIDKKKLSKKKIKDVMQFRYDAGPFRYIRQIGLELLRKFSFARSLSQPLDESRNGAIRSRNFIMSPPVSQVYSKQSQETDLLQEYFVPLSGFVHFMHHLDAMTRLYGINLVHVELRFIPCNQENFLSYARKDSVGVVLFFNQKISEDATTRVQQWTRSLIDYVHALGGTYYLPIQLHATAEQLRAVYPTIDAIFGLKKWYDPQELFVNHFYKQYKE